MTNTTIATNVHQTLDVHCNFRTEIAFDLILSTDYFTNLGSLVVRPFCYFLVTINSSLVQNFG